MNDQNSKSGKVVDWDVLKKLIPYANPYRWNFALLVFLIVLMGVLAPIRPKIIQVIIDDHISDGDFGGLVTMTGVLMIILVFQALTTYAFTFLSGWIGQNIIKDLRIELYSHLLKLKLQFFDKTPIGRLVTRVVSDIETLSEVFSQGLAAIIGDLLQLAFILTVMFYTDWKLTLVCLCTLPLLIISTYVFKEKIKVAFNDVRNAVSSLNTFVQEHITGMNIVQIFNREEEEYRRFTEINKKHKKANIKSVLYYSIYYPVSEIIQAAGIGLLVWFGSKQVFGEVVELGVLIAFIMYIQMFFRPIRMIADRFNTLQMGIVSSERIFKLLHTEEVIAKSGNQKPTEFKGGVSFENVDFAYVEDNYVLKNINFEVKPGETVALVGATGAGKSSIINLLSRFYEINSGKILIDGISVADYEIDYLREKIGVVLQDVFLFSDSIENNISLNNPNISLDQIKKAADLVGAREFIERMPGGYEYNVQERGATLSVGQRQLISFVRVMVYNPEILVLDEATSSVDSETEELIQNAIGKIMHGRTSLVIAHRLSTIQRADKIIVLDKGRIVEIGSHSDLLKQNGYYSQLYEMQQKALA